jgi:hypothetical protein
MGSPADLVRSIMRWPSSGMPRKAYLLRNMSGLPADRVSAPVLGQIQFAVDEGMPLRGDVGEEDAHLAVLHPAGAPAILRADAGRVVPAFGKAAFIEHQDREGRLVLWRRLRREQGMGK